MKTVLPAHLLESHLELGQVENQRKTIIPVIIISAMISPQQ